MSSNSKSTIISLAAVVLAVVAILLSFCRGHHDTVSFGTLATVLSILVTILVTWNIYTLVDFKNEVKVINSYREELDKIKNTQESNSNEITQLYSHIETINTNIGTLNTKLNRLCDTDLLNAQIYFEWLCQSLNKIAVYCKIGQPEFAKDEAQNIIDDFNEEERWGLTHYQHQRILSFFGETQISEVLPNYSELKSCLNNIKEIDRGLHGTITKKQKNHKNQ